MNKGNLELQKIAGICGSGPCPTLYQSKDGRYFIQGYKTDESLANAVSVPDNEGLVEVDIDFLKDVVNKIK